MCSRECQAMICILKHCSFTASTIFLAFISTGNVHDICAPNVIYYLNMGPKSMKADFNDLYACQAYAE